MKNYNTVKAYFESSLIQHVTNQCEITLNLDNVKILATYQDNKYIGFEGFSTTTEGGCRHCGQVIRRFKQYRVSYTTMARHNDRNVVIKLYQKMYHCPDCKSSTTEQLLKKTGKNQKCDQFIQSMVKCLKETISYSTIARLHKVSTTNLIRHFDKTTIAQCEIDRLKSRNICVDEVRFIKQKHANYQFVIMDSDNTQVLDILRSRQSGDILEYLRKNYTQLHTFTQDLWRPYRTAAYRLFPGVKVIADRFHVVRQFMWAFSRSRIKLAKQQNKRTCKHWKLLTKAQFKLDDKGKARLECLLDEDLKLKELHQAKELALELFRCRDSQSYLALLPAFKEQIDKEGLEEFQKAYKTLVNWHQEIINMFDHPYSNGAMERTNRVIKQSKNIAFGFKNLARATKLVQYRVN